MSTKTFLLEECENVKDLLEKALRHDYGIEGSGYFFAECTARLAFLTSELQNTDPTNLPMLASLGRFLGDLAKLICRIERSSLGEYSWPFVEELKKISDAICREKTALNPDAPPKVFVFADGGLDSYAIYTERNRPTASKQRLLTIVFPKSLKNFVLLHTILGHELGHAIWHCSKHQSELKQDVIRHLQRAGGALESPAATAAHLFSASAPPEAKSILAGHIANGLNEGNVFQACNWSSWFEEVLCDLVGLVIFGPGFVAAQCRLLYSVEASGTALLPNHPPVGWRINMVLKGAKLMGYDALPDKGDPLRAHVEAFWNYLDNFRKPDPWFDLLPDAQLADALQGVQKLLVAHHPASYPVPTHERIGFLLDKVVRLVPPIGHVFDGDRKPSSFDVDFRHVIYAGWVATQHASAIPFKRINELCEHAIMQQRAIEISLKGQLQ
jgi:hypothetical protein